MGPVHSQKSLRVKEEIERQKQNNVRRKTCSILVGFEGIRWSSRAKGYGQSLEVTEAKIYPFETAGRKAPLQPYHCSSLGSVINFETIDCKVINLCCFILLFVEICYSRYMEANKYYEEPMYKYRKITEKELGERKQ